MKIKKKKKMENLQRGRNKEIAKIKHFYLKPTFFDVGGCTTPV